MEKASTGTYSTGYRSTGDWSTGHYSTGDKSTGYYSTGAYSTGTYSTGDWSISNYSTGHFSTEDYSGFGVFDKPCTLEKWDEAEKPNFFYFHLTERVSKYKMTEEEKTKNPTYEITDGYLKTYEYQTAWKNSWDKQEDKENQLKLLLALPNFNWEKFTLISGLTEEYMRGDSDIIEVNGKKYKLITD